MLNARDQLEYELSNSSDMVEQTAYVIYGAVVTTTRGFGKVEINLSEETKRVFIKVYLKWVVNTKKMKKIHDIWLKRAESNANKYIPDGYKLLIYYEGLKYDKGKS